MTDQPLDLDAQDDRAVQTLSNEGAQCGSCGDEPGDRVCPDCEKCRARYVAALRAAGWAPQPENAAMAAEIRRLRAELAKVRADTLVEAEVEITLAIERNKAEHPHAEAMATRRLGLRHAERILRDMRQDAEPAAVVAHVVADDSDDPEHIDDCPGCQPAARP